MNNQRYLLALNRIDRVGSRTIAMLLNKWPNLEQLFAISQREMQAAGLPQALAAAISSFDLQQVEVDLLWQQQETHHLLTWEDANYPHLLREIYDAPPVLYASGDISCIKNHSIAVIGSRKPSVTGRENAWRFAYELANLGLTIVSGLALGIDAQAHLGCLQAGGKTIAVMGTGINRIYPASHQKLAAQVAESGLLLSEFPLNSLPIAGHFPRRNRIISGLSLATLVVEAAVRSGSLITARLALEQNREVLAIPGSIHNPLARGCHMLLQQGAKLVTSVADIVSELPGDLFVSPQDVTQEAIASLNENLVKWIGYEATTIEQIIARSGYEIETVMCELADLELNGVIRTVPGGYMRCF